MIACEGQKGLAPEVVSELSEGNNCRYLQKQHIGDSLDSVSGQHEQRSTTVEIDNNTIIIGNFNPPLTSMDRSSRQKINMATVVLNDTIEQLDLIYIYRILHQQTAEYTFFSSAHEMFSRIDHKLGHKTNLTKFNRIEIISSIFL